MYLIICMVDVLEICIQIFPLLYLYMLCSCVFDTIMLLTRTKQHELAA